jgi:zinc protease
MVVGSSGVGDFSATELQRKLAGRQVTVSPYIGTLTEGFSGGCVPEDLEILFQLVHLYGTEPRRDREAFGSLTTRLRGILQNRRSQPEALFQDRLQILTSEGHFRERPFTPELLEELDFETAHEVYAERFADFSEAVFIFTGNFSPPEMRELSERYLATLPSTGREESWADPGIEFPDETVTDIVRAGIEEKGRVAVVYGGDFAWSVEREYVLRSLITLMDIRLREVIREEASGTYGVRVGGGAGPYPEEEFRITVSFGCDPDRAEELTELVFTELDDIRKNLPSELNMTKIKEMDRRSYEEALEENRFWLNSLEEADFYDLPYTVLRGFPERVDSLTGEDIRRMAREVLDAPYVRLTLLPEKE